MLKLFERETKFTSIFFVNAKILILRRKNLKKQKYERKKKKLKKNKKIQVVLTNTLWKKRLKSPPALRGRF